MRRCYGIPADRKVLGMFWHLVAVKYCLHTRRKNEHNSRESSAFQWQVSVCFLFFFLSLVKSTCLSQQRGKKSLWCCLQPGYKSISDALSESLCTLTGWKVGGRERERKRERERENVRGRVLNFTRQWLS